jgi:TRAP-type C4-dicarboxylate transport system permease small subunit
LSAAKVTGDPVNERTLRRQRAPRRRIEEENDALQATATAAAAPRILGASTANYPPGVPRWLQALDSAVIALINVALAIEVVVVFAATMARNLMNSSSVMWVDEASPLFLIALSFLGGAVAYSRQQFIAITVLADRAPPRWREIFAATSEWIVVVVSLLIGIWSVPLIVANAEEKTLLLGIHYIWLTLPITLGSAMFVLRAGLSFLHRERPAQVASTLAVGACLALFLVFRASLGAHPITTADPTVAA